MWKFDMGIYLSIVNVKRLSNLDLRHFDCATIVTDSFVLSGVTLTNRCFRMVTIL